MSGEYSRGVGSAKSAAAPFGLAGALQSHARPHGVRRQAKRDGAFTLAAVGTVANLRGVRTTAGSGDRSRDRYCGERVGVKREKARKQRACGPS